MSEWPRQSPVDIALRGVCPRCGRGKLFRGLLDVVDRCPACGLDLRGNDAGDGPAVFVIMGLGAMHVLLWGPLTTVLAVWMLRVLKAWLIGQQYTHRSTSLDN